MRKLGFSVGGARVGRLVDLEVDAATPDEAKAAVERMCQELLANPLIESFEIEVAESVSVTAADRRARLPRLERRP